MGVDPISIGLMVGGALLQGYGALKGAQAQKNLQRAQQGRANMEAQNQRLEQVRQARIARAKTIQAGENQGAGGSSSVTAAAGNATAEGAANIHYINQEQDVGQQITRAQGQINDAQGISQIGGAITNIGGTVFGNSDYISAKAKSVFG